MKYFTFPGILTLLTVSLMLNLVNSTSCSQPKESPTALKDAYQGKFLMGTALNALQIMEQDSLSAPLIDQHFNSITPENCMKWERIHPEPGVYNFELADRFIELGMEKEMYMVGHTLVWHSQTPRWVFLDDEGNLTTRDTLLMRMRDHIHTVVGRYKGKVHCWDVVNEAVGDDGNMRNSLWYQIIGEDYIEKAFTYASEADPEALLIYNDYSLPDPAKREGAVQLVKDLQSKGIPIGGIGMQGHYYLSEPPVADIDASITAFSELGIEVMITEMDINVLPAPSDYSGAEVSKRFEMEAWLNPYTEGLPDSVQHILTNRYRDLFTLFRDHSEHIRRVTFWGVHDGVSWKNNWPVPGRTNYPLLFDREGSPKPGYDAVISVVSSQ